MKNKNKTVLVTASAKRLGKIIATDLVKLGWSVAIHYNKSKQIAEETANDLIKIGGNVTLYKANFSNNSDVEKLINDLEKNVIARAILFEPKLLLLDEPFAALDNLSREMISIELVSLIKKKSMTVIMVTHSIEEAALLSDEVLVTGITPISVVKKFIPPKISSVPISAK